ncbi:MAG: hypothetical protein R2734_19820 [Nocardioides sp.]
MSQTPTPGLHRAQHRAPRPRGAAARARQVGSRVAPRHASPGRTVTLSGVAASAATGLVVTGGVLASGATSTIMQAPLAASAVSGTPTLSAAELTARRALRCRGRTDELRPTRRRRPSSTPATARPSRGPRTSATRTRAPSPRPCSASSASDRTNSPAWTSST